MTKLTTWTPEEDAVLRRFYQTGAAIETIIKLVSKASGNVRSKNSIIGRANRFGLSRDGDMNRDIWLMKSRGLSQSEIGKATGMSRNAANGRALRHEALLRKDALDLEICAAIDAGESNRSIASRFLVHPSHVAALKAELEKL